MPGPTGTEIAVSTYWSQHYSPFDVADTGTFVFTQDGYIAEIWDVVRMNDGTFWMDYDRDGWFDAGGRSNGDVFDGYEWRRREESEGPEERTEGSSFVFENVETAVSQDYFI